MASQLAIRRMDRPFTHTKTHESLDSLADCKLLHLCYSFSPPRVSAIYDT